MLILMLTLTYWLTSDLTGEHELEVCQWGNWLLKVSRLLVLQCRRGISERFLFQLVVYFFLYGLIDNTLPSCKVTKIPRLSVEFKSESGCVEWGDTQPACSSLTRTGRSPAAMTSTKQTRPGLRPREWEERRGSSLRTDTPGEPHHNSQCRQILHQAGCKCESISISGSHVFFVCASELW